MAHRSCRAELTICRGTRKLDDEELDSGDDEERRDRLAETVEAGDDTQGMEEEFRFVPTTIGRIQAPETVNDEVWTRASQHEDRTD